MEHTHTCCCFHIFFLSQLQLKLISRIVKWLFKNSLFRSQLNHHLPGETFSNHTIFTAVTRHPPTPVYFISYTALYCFFKSLIDHCLLSETEEQPWESWRVGCFAHYCIPNPGHGRQSENVCWMNEWITDGFSASRVLEIISSSCFSLQVSQLRFREVKWLIECCTVNYYRPKVWVDWIRLVL